MNNAVHSGHPSRHRIGHNHRWLDSDHHDIDHGHRPIAFGCRLDVSRHRGGNRRPIVDDPMIMDARYPYYDRICARPSVSSCSEAQSGELGRLSFG